MVGFCSYYQDAYANAVATTRISSHLLNLKMRCLFLNLDQSYQVITLPTLALCLGINPKSAGFQINAYTRG